LGFPPFSPPSSLFPIILSLIKGNRERGKENRKSGIGRGNGKREKRGKKEKGEMGRGRRERVKEEKERREERKKKREK